MAKRTIGKPRFYADIPQYLKALGYYGGSPSGNPDIWNMNPYQSTTLPSTAYLFNINKPSLELDQLLTNMTGLSSSGIYASFLNHNGAGSYFGFSIGSLLPNYENIINFAQSGGGYGSSEFNGYSIANITDFTGSDTNIGTIGFNNISEINGGCAGYGRWFEPSHAFDLKGSVTTAYDGIKSQRTIGGSTLTNINHLGVPSWGDLPAWTLEKQDGHDYKVGGVNGRRQWKVSLSYLTDDNLFHKAGNENQFFTYDPDGGGYTFDESMSSFFKLSLNGKLPFIFCPDSSATDLEFALCKIDKDPSFKQVANNLFSTNFTITEVF